MSDTPETAEATPGEVKPEAKPAKKEKPQRSVIVNNTAGRFFWPYLDGKLSSTLSHCVGPMVP